MVSATSHPAATYLAASFIADPTQHAEWYHLAAGLFQAVLSGFATEQAGHAH